MNKLIVRDFTCHNELGESVRAVDLIAWSFKQKPWRRFNVCKYSWEVKGERLEVLPHGNYWSELPDATGFICFENNLKADNCLLRDAYGKERMRLVVPWEMAGNVGTSPEMRSYGKPRPERMWFENISTPYAHPETNEPGDFGVRAYLEYGDGLYENCDYYFELDWHTGQFLWGRPIRD